MNENILQILKGIRPEFDFEGIDDFIEAGLLDSYDIVMLVVELEKNFSVVIDGVEVVPENFRNPETIAALIAKSSPKS